MAFTTDEKGKTTKTENKNRGHVALQGVPLCLKIKDLIETEISMVHYLILRYLKAQDNG